MALLVLLSCGAAGSGAADEKPLLQFDLAAGNLGDSLQRFAAEADLQVIYEQQLVAGKRAVAIVGRMSGADALDRLLRGTGLHWRAVGDATVAIYGRVRSPQIDVRAGAPVAPRPDAGGEVVQLGDIDVLDDLNWLSNSTSNSAYGFNKPLLETPRSVSLVGEEAIDAFGLSAVEDLARLVPGVFTTTRFGIQGSVDVRNVPADTYFRGIRRLTLQGHGRSVLAAMDSIEIVGGPPSPLYGMGKIGGYTNVVPKSGRARTGRYMPRTQAYVQGIAGQYDRKELSFGVGGPMSLLKDRGRQGGYYLYGLLEDSDSYAEGVPIRQKVLQAASDIDDAVGRFRLETGVNFQDSRTSGALIGRLTQDLVDNGRYIGGAPLVNLDLDGSGAISHLEMQSASPVRGNLSSGNQPLAQVWAWPTDASGKPLPLGQFPTVAGIPQSLYDYLVAHPEADPGGLLRAQGVGGPRPISGSVPIGFALDPRTVRYSAFDPRHSSAYERDSHAQFLTAYADLIHDVDPDFTIKNQLFFDSMNQHKFSDQPLRLIQDVQVVEDKLTLTRRLAALPSWLRVNALLSANARNTVSSGRTTTPASDYSNHRTDAMAATWSSSPGGLTANSRFDGATIPWTSIYRTEFSEFGLGMLFDIDIYDNTNVLIGGRIDGSQAENTDYAGRFNINTGTSANPGAYLASDDTARGWDHGESWSISVSQTLPHNLHPYATAGRSSIMLDGNNNSLTNAMIRAGHIGAATLHEVGIKASMFHDRLLVTSSLYRQRRAEVSAHDDAAVLGAYATATTTHGWQSELKWAPRRDWLLSLYVLKQHTEYTPNVGGVVQVDARSLGFQDVVDAYGNVIYPAEAFLYGGRARLVLPDDMPQYRKKQGNPDTQIGVSSIYRMRGHWGFTFKGQYLSKTCSGRLCLVTLPASYVFDAGALWQSPHVNLKLDVFNAADRHYYRARTGDTLGDVIAQAMPGRRWQLTAKYVF